MTDARLALGWPLAAAGLALALLGCDAGAEPAATPAPQLGQSSSTAAGGEANESDVDDSSEGGSGDGESTSPASPVPCQLVEDGFGPDGEVPVRAEPVVSGLEVPWGILFFGDGDMLVTERPGRLRWVRDGTLIDAPLADVDALAVGEGGLLGIAAHPDFATNRSFFLYMTVRAGTETQNRVELWRLTGSGDELGAERVRAILEDIPAARFHNGGRLRIGPDRMLYVGTGDARNPSLAQDPNSLAGKILRLNLDGSVSETNPLGREGAFVMGVRNTQGFDWRPDGAMLITDHGPSGELGRSGHDEVNVARGGANLGWPPIYGCRDRPEMIRPSLTWDPAVPPGGAARYTGDAIGAWRGSLLIGTLGSKHLHRVVFEPGTARVRSHEVYFRGDPPAGLGRLREVIMGPDDQLYVTTSNCDGRGTCPPDGDKIFRILPAG